MIQPSLNEVKTLARHHNLIPVWCELPADLDTPISVYLKLRSEGASFLLESVKGGEQLGRYSFLGFTPTGILTARAGKITFEGATEVLLEGASGDPLSAARDLLAQYHPAQLEGLPPFVGGLVGYVGYDTARHFERVPPAPDPGLDLPDAMLMLAEQLVIFDHVKHRLLVVVNAHIGDTGNVAAVYDTATAKIERLIARLQQPLPLSTVSTGTPATQPEPWTSNITPAQFEDAVLQAKEYIAAGDIFQVVLSQRLSRRTTALPFDIYRTLRRINPSPYMFYLELPGDLRLIGSSPEVLVQLKDGEATVRPLAGTRRRGANAAEDLALAQELLADPKERAEHVMLVDLGRNDLGRVCRYGSIHVTELMAIETYSHVMHIVSHVSGELRAEFDAFDLLRATFPAGTVSGAPKIRAMEIIAELERVQRGPYAGAVGYFGYKGNMDTCIAIRTLIMQGDRVHVQAGAGIVADSDPTREYEETLNKAKALAEAVALTEI